MCEETHKWDGVFKSLKRINSSTLALEIDIELAKTFSPFDRVGFLLHGSSYLYPANANSFYSVQNDLNYVQSFPDIVWSVKNMAYPQFEGHLILKVNGNLDPYVRVFIEDKLNAAPVFEYDLTIEE